MFLADLYADFDDSLCLYRSFLADVCGDFDDSLYVCIIAGEVLSTKVQLVLYHDDAAVPTQGLRKVPDRFQ